MFLDNAGASANVRSKDENISAQAVTEFMVLSLYEARGRFNARIDGFCFISLNSRTTVPSKLRFHETILIAFCISASDVYFE